MRKHPFRRLRCQNRSLKRRLLLEELESRFALATSITDISCEAQPSKPGSIVDLRMSETDFTEGDHIHHGSSLTARSVHASSQNTWHLYPATVPEPEANAEITIDFEIPAALVLHQSTSSTNATVLPWMEDFTTDTTENLVAGAGIEPSSETDGVAQPSPEISTEPAEESTISPAINTPPEPQTPAPPAPLPPPMPTPGATILPAAAPNPVSIPSIVSPVPTVIGPIVNTAPASSNEIPSSTSNSSSPLPSTPVPNSLSTPIPTPKPPQTTTPSSLPTPSSTSPPVSTPVPSSVSTPIPTATPIPGPTSPLPATIVPPTQPTTAPAPTPTLVVPSTPTPVPSQIPKPPPTPPQAPSAISNPPTTATSPATATPETDPSPSSASGTNPEPASAVMETCGPASAGFDDGKPLDARDDNILKNKQQNKLINVLANDSIHQSESFTHRSTIVAAGNSGVHVYTMNGPDGESFYWFHELSGSSTLKTLEDGTTAQVVLSGFQFSKDLGRRCGNQQWASWVGGTAVITSAWGTRTISNITFTGGVVIDHHGDFGKATGLFSGEGNSLQIALPSFDGRKAEQTIDGKGLLVFANPPKLSITTTPREGIATIVDGQIAYQPHPGTEGVDRFEYQIMTELGDQDSATVAIGTMDLDVFTLAGNELNEIKEDQPGLWISVNHDDDNMNRDQDLQDSGFIDDDLAKLTLEELAPQGLRPLNGYLTLSFDPQLIRIWHTRQKDLARGFDDAEVISNSTRFYVNSPQWDGELWIEGQSSGQTEISLAWHDLKLQMAAIVDSVHVHVLKYDFDIDSDNDNGFNYPDNSDWEEYLEANKYGIGKLIEPQASHFTPTRLRLPTDLPLNDPSLRVKFDFQPAGQSGILFAWNTFKADRNRMDLPIGEGGNRVLASMDYSLSDLAYDPVSGGITLYLEAWKVFPGHSTKKGVDENLLIDDRIKAVLLMDGAPILWDEVKYMAVEPNTFYPELQKAESLRNAIAAHIVYKPGHDDPKFALKLLSPEEMLRLGLPPKVIDLIGPANTESGFKNSLYLDHISGKLVLAFAGTDDVQDIITDIWQGLGGYTAQYNAALEIGRGLDAVPDLEDRIVITGHSLGGGLASAAAVASGIHADTFNAAGLLKSVLEYDAAGNPIAGNPAELANYDAAAAGSNLIEAYYLDYDLLSFVQDSTILQDAIGHRNKMDGPMDLQLGFQAIKLAVQLANGATWLSTFATLGEIGYIMVKCHTSHYYHYGLMVNETTGWDVYGYHNF